MLEKTRAGGTMLEARARDWGTSSVLWQFWLGAMLISGKMVLRLKLTRDPVWEL